MTTLILGMVVMDPLVVPPTSAPLQPGSLNILAAMDQAGRFWDCRDRKGLEGLRGAMQAADRVVIDRLPWSWPFGDAPVWSLEVAERAIRLGSQTYEVPIDILCLRYRLRAVPWHWSPSVWPWRSKEVIPIEALKAQANAMQMATAAVYVAQGKILPERLLQHLTEIEMPAALVHQEITATGLLLSQKRLERLRKANPRMMKRLSHILLKHGINAPMDDSAVLKWLPKEIKAFFVDGVNDDNLKDASKNHPAMRPLRQLRRLSNLMQQPWIRHSAVSSDGRVHPLNHTLAAPTTITISNAPAISGVQKELRPLIIAGPGMAILESDYGSMELMTLAARYGDQRLADLCHQGSAVGALAKIFFPELKDLDSGVIKATHPDEYGQSKTIIYGILYGRTYESLALVMSISEDKAKRLLKRLWTYCPDVDRGLRSMVAHAERHLEVPIVNGLVRQLQSDEIAAGYRVRTIAMNSPVQGVAAVVFRAASILVNQVLKRLGGRLVMVNHDAFLYEVPLGQEIIAKDSVEAAMKQAFTDILGDMVKPKVETNMTDLTCWNKDGHSDSFDRFMVDPTFRL